MSTKIINISLPQEIVKKVDELAKRSFASRSDFIRQALVQKILEEQKWTSFFDTTNAKGKKLGFKSEQDVFDAAK